MILLEKEYRLDKSELQILQLYWYCYIVFYYLFDGYPIENSEIPNWKLWWRTMIPSLKCLYPVNKKWWVITQWLQLLLELCSLCLSLSTHTRMHARTHAHTHAHTHTHTQKCCVFSVYQYLALCLQRLWARERPCVSATVPPTSRSVEDTTTWNLWDCHGVCWSWCHTWPCPCPTNSTL